MLQVIRYTKRPVPALTRKEREEKKKQTGKDYQEHRIKQTDETCESSFLRHANQHPFFYFYFTYANIRYVNELLYKTGSRAQSRFQCGYVTTRVS